MIVGFLWLAGAFAFVISAIYLSKSPQSEGDTGSSEQARLITFSSA